MHDPFPLAKYLNFEHPFFPSSHDHGCPLYLLRWLKLAMEVPLPETRHHHLRIPTWLSSYAS
jgi:hypothetical protein